MSILQERKTNHVETSIPKLLSVSNDGSVEEHFVCFAKHIAHEGNKRSLFTIIGEYYQWYCKYDIFT